MFPYSGVFIRHYKSIRTCLQKLVLKYVFDAGSLQQYVNSEQSEITKVLNLGEPLSAYSGTSDRELSQIRHRIINLSTKDKTYSPSIIPTIHFEPSKEKNLYKEQMS